MGKLHRRLVVEEEQRGGGGSPSSRAATLREGAQSKGELEEWAGGSGLAFIEGGREKRRGGEATMLGWPAIKAMKAHGMEVCGWRQ
jgi:hypothetical protein